MSKQEKRIFILEGHLDYEGFCILGVYNTFCAASTAKLDRDERINNTSVLDKEEYHYDWYEISCHEVIL